MVFVEKERYLQMIAHAVAVTGMLLGARAEIAYISAIVLATGWAVSITLSGLLGGHISFWRAIGPAYIGLPLLALFFLRFDPDLGFVATVWLLFVVWATDTFAYMVGRFFGGPKLSPRFSPNKTWSGLAGGTIGAVIVAVFIAYAASLPNIWILAILAAMLAIVSQIGDLFESAAKRHFGVKDTSNLIPGHGGMLDRMDGLMFAAVFCAGIGLVRGADLYQVARFVFW